MEKKQKIREELKQTLDEAEWSWLKFHAARDALIIVAADLDLLEVGVSLALDDKEAVSAWIAAGAITKPSVAQLEGWNRVPDRRFMALVVQPYVLIQDSLAKMTH